MVRPSFVAFVAWLLAVLSPKYPPHTEIRIVFDRRSIPECNSRWHLSHLLSQTIRQSALASHCASARYRRDLDDVWVRFRHLGAPTPGPILERTGHIKTGTSTH